MATFRKAGEAVPVESGTHRGVTYRLRVPDVYERQMVRRELARLGARRYGGLAVYAQLREALREIMSETQDAAALTTFERLIDHQIDLIRDLVAASPSEIGAAYQKVVQGDRSLLRLIGIVQRSPLPAAQLYAEMQAVNATYNGLYGIVAARLLLDGIDGDPLTWSPARRGETPSDTLNAIPDTDFEAIAVAMQAVSEVSQDEAKNSASPSSGDSAPESSSAASMPLETTH